MFYYSLSLFHTHTPTDRHNLQSSLLFFLSHTHAHPSLFLFFSPYFSHRYTHTQTQNTLRFTYTYLFYFQSYCNFFPLLPCYSSLSFSLSLAFYLSFSLSLSLSLSLSFSLSISPSLSLSLPITLIRCSKRISICWMLNHFPLCKDWFTNHCEENGKEDCG